MRLNQQSISYNEMERPSLETKSSKSKHTKSSAQIVASIHDLLTIILLLLPIKPLTRFKSVCKHWHSLIANPKFLSLRIHNPNPNPARGLFLLCSNVSLRPKFSHPTPYFEYQPFSSLNIPSFKSLNFTHDPSGIMILQSCNGLLLCSNFQYNVYYVCNPTTRKISTLPSLVRRKRSSITIRGACLAFDPVKSHHYKVVFVRALGQVYDSRNQINVYSSESGSWKTVGEPFQKYMNSQGGVYWNGCVFWINGGAADGEPFYFNIETQELKTMPMPQVTDDHKWLYYYFGESCDHLHYVHNASIFGLDIELLVHEMKRDCSGWFVKYRVDLLTVFKDFPGMIVQTPDWGYYAYFPTCVVRGKEEEESFLVLQILGKLVRLNLVDGTFEMLPEFEGSEVKLREFSVGGFQYIESLFCV